MAWAAHQSTSAEYRHTAGEEFVCPKLSAAWGRVTGANRAESGVFEEISPPSANPILDHVVLYSTPKVAIDIQVPDLVAKSVRWETLTKAVPGFTVPMLRIAELMYKTEWYFTEKLNDIVLNQGMGAFNHVSEAISKARDKYTPRAQHTAVNEALLEVFKPFVSDEVQTSTAMAQWYTCSSWMNKWYTCLSWMNKRNIVGHPLGAEVNRIDDITLADFKVDVQNNVDYDKVREAALVMVKLAEAMLKDGSAN